MIWGGCGVCFWVGLVGFGGDFGVVLILGIAQVLDGWMGWCNIDDLAFMVWGLVWWF